MEEEAGSCHLIYGTKMVVVIAYFCPKWSKSLDNNCTNKLIWLALNICLKVNAVLSSHDLTQFVCN